MNENEERAFREGARGNSMYNTGRTPEERRAYERGKATAEYAGKVGEVGTGLLIILGVVMKFLILYSPFILLGLLSIYPFRHSFSLFYSFSFPSLAVFLVVLSIVSYLFFCVFHFLRAIVLEARKKDIGYWLPGYLLMLLFVTICPSVCAFVVIGYIFGKGGFLPDNIVILLFQLVISIMALYKSYRRYDLLGEDSTPAIARWAFAKGNEVAEKRFSVVSKDKKNNNSPKLQVIYFFLAWAISSYLVFFIVSALLTVLGMIALRIFTGNEKFMIVTSFYSASIICWLFLKSQYKEIFIHSRSPVNFEFFSNTLFLLMAVVLFVIIILVPLRSFNFPYSFDNININTILIFAPLVSCLIGLFWLNKFGVIKELKSFAPK